MELNAKLFVAYAFRDLLGSEAHPSVEKFFLLWAKARFKAEDDEIDAFLSAMGAQAEELAEVFSLIGDRCRDLSQEEMLRDLAESAYAEDTQADAKQSLRLRALLKADPMEILALEGKRK